MKPDYYEYLKLDISKSSRGIFLNAKQVFEEFTVIYWICEVIHFFHLSYKREILLYKYTHFLKNMAQYWAQTQVWHGTKQL